jgi:predicted nucleic acid-binding protein
MTSMSDKDFIDTNVLVYAWDSADPQRQAVAQRIIEHAVAEENAVISVQVLSEFFVTVTRKLATPLPVAVAADIVDDLCALTVVEADHTLVREAIAIHAQQQISYWDAMIIASAARAGCTRLLSEDLQRDRTIAGVRIVDPFARSR